MDWFYDSNGQQSGPISDIQLNDLIRAGTVANDTLVWRDGMADWQPLHQARPADASNPPSLPPMLPPVIANQLGSFCAECMRPFPQSEMVVLNKSWVCAQCKPIFLQRLMEGSTPGAATLSSGLLWRDQRKLVTRSNTPMPDRCVRCNAPANSFRLKRELGWHPPVYYLLILAGPLIYVIVAMLARKTALLHVGLCAIHRSQRTRFIIGSWIAALVGILLLVIGIGRPNAFLGLLGLVLILAALIAGLMKAQVVNATKIEKDLVWVKGVNETFLAELPEWNGPR